jgi:hypothetical protein
MLARFSGRLWPTLPSIIDVELAGAIELYEHEFIEMQGHPEGVSVGLSLPPEFRQ